MALVDALLRGDSATLADLQRSRPDLYAIKSDFFFLLVKPNAFDGKPQSQKWRRSIRILSEQWHLRLALSLKFAPHSALSLLFGGNE